MAILAVQPPHIICEKIYVIFINMIRNQLLALELPTVTYDISDLLISFTF